MINYSNNHKFCRFLCLFLCLLIGWGLTGCAGWHLYNAEKHVAAQAAETNFKEVEISKTLTDERDRIAEILGYELKIVRQHTLATRDADLLRIIGGTNKKASWGRLKKSISDRILFSSGGKTDAEITAFNILHQREKSLEGKDTEFALLLRSEGVTDEISLSCPLISASLKNKDNPILTTFFNLYKEQCEKVVQARKKIDEIPGEIGKISKKIYSVEAAESDLNNSISVAKIEYQKSLKDYTDKLKASQADDIEKQVTVIGEKLDAIGKSAQATTNTLKQLGFENLSKSAKIETLEAQKLLIEEVIQAFMDGGAQLQPELPEDALTKNRIAFTLGMINRELGTALKYPKLNVLVLQNEHLRLQIEGLKNQVANSKAHLNLLKKKRNAIRLELNFLAEAKSFQKNLPASCTNNALNDAFEKEPSCREGISRIMLLYANSWSIGRLSQEEIDYKILGLRHIAVLDNSENALAQWENLISIPVSQLVALHGSGITPDEIARFISALGTTAGLLLIGI